MTKPKSKPNEEFVGSGLTPEEQSRGKKIFAEYRKSYPQLNKPSNLQLLEELVWLECLQERYKKQVGIVTSPSTTPDGKVKIEPVPGHLQDSISENLTQIIELKTKLSLFEDKQILDAFRVLDEMIKKAAEHRKLFPLQYKVTCPHCTKIFFLKRKTEGHDTFISPFYADDKILKNDELHACWKEGILPKVRYAKALGVSPDYIAWLDEKIYKNGKPKEA